MRKITIIVFLVFLLVSKGFSAGVPVNIEGVQNLGMGGPGTALWTNYGILYNPALLGLRSGFHMTVFDFPFSVSDDIFKFYSFYKDNQSDLEDFSNLSVQKQTDLIREITRTVTNYTVRLKIGVLNPNISVGPFPFGRRGDLMWGVGVYSLVDAGAKMHALTLIPNVDIWARIDGVLVVPVVYKTKSLPLRLPGEVSAGINLKYIMRSRIDEKRMSILEFENYDISADELKPGSGLGWDWGVLYDFSDKWNFALSLQDLLSTRIGYSDGTGEVIKGRANLGASYKLNDMITFAADLRDIKFADIGKASLFAKLYLGGEFSLVNVIKLRGGFYQGYPSIGFGLGGALNYAYYTRELSRYPGLRPETSHVLSLSLRF